jgi:hypothetical protein
MSKKFKDGPEIDVILRIISEGSIRRAISLGLCDKYFSNPVALLAWRKINDFANRQATFGETPSAEYLSQLVPGFPNDKQCPERTLGELIEVVRTGALDRSLRNLIADMHKLLSEFNSPEAAFEHAVGEIKRLTNVSSTLPSHLSMDIGEACESIRDEYQRKANGGGLIGIPFPYEPLNRAMGGLCPGTFNVIYAPSKHGKTWISLEIAAVHPFLYANARVLVISCEMPINQVYRRILARLAEVDYGGVVNGNLSETQLKRYMDVLGKLEDEQSDKHVDIAQDGNAHRCIRVIRPSARSGAGVDSIRNAIEVFEPDLVFVDAVYRLANAKGGRDYDWRGIQENMATLKDMSAEFQIPVIVTAQANRSGWGSVEDIDFDEYGDISMNSGFIQEADAVMRLHKFRLPDNSHRILVTLPAVRESETGAFTINFKPCTDFSLDCADVTPDYIKGLLAATPAQLEGGTLMIEHEDDEDEPNFGSKGGIFKK